MASLIPAEVMLQALARSRQMQTVPTGMGQVNPGLMTGMDNPAMRLQTAAAMGRQGQSSTPQTGTGRPGPLTQGVNSEKYKALLLDAYGVDDQDKDKFSNWAKDRQITPEMYKTALQAHHQQRAQQQAFDLHKQQFGFQQQKEQQTEALRKQSMETAAKGKETAHTEHQQEHEHDQQLRNLQHQQSLAASAFDQEKVSSLQQQIDALMKPKQQTQSKAGGSGKMLDRATALQFYQQAGGDPAKARELAKQTGF